MMAVWWNIPCQILYSEHCGGNEAWQWHDHLEITEGERNLITAARDDSYRRKMASFFAKSNLSVAVLLTPSWFPPGVCRSHFGWQGMTGHNCPLLSCREVHIVVGCSKLAESKFSPSNIPQLGAVALLYVPHLLYELMSLLMCNKRVSRWSQQYSAKWHFLCPHGTAMTYVECLNLLPLRRTTSLLFVGQGLRHQLVHLLAAHGVAVASWWVSSSFLG